MELPLRDRLFDARESIIEIADGVGHGNEAGFVGAGGEVDALLEEVPEELLEEGEVLFGDGVDVDDFFIEEVEAEHRADLIDAVRDPFFRKDVAESGGEVIAKVCKMLISAVLIEFLELGEAGNHGEGVSAEGSRLVDGTIGRELIHDIGPSAEGSHGKSAADDLAHGGEVRGEVFEFLHTAFGETEAGHDFIENDECAVLGREIAHCLQVAIAGENEAGIGGVGFDDDGSDLVAVIFEDFFQALEVVVGKGDGFVGEGLGHARGVRLAKGESAGSGGDEEGIDVAVVAAFEFYDLVTPGESASEADGGHRGLGAGADHADFFDGWHPISDQLRHFHFVDIRNPVRDTILGGLMDRASDDRGGMAQDIGAPGADVVDV